MPIRKNLQDTTREAKIISLHDRANLSPQIPEQPSLPTMLLQYTLTDIDRLIEEHFRQNEGTNNSYL